MGLTLERKKEIVAEVADIAGKASSVIAAEYIGLTVSDMHQLRQSARQANVYLKVVRNTLARRALQDTPYQCMVDGLVGPLVLAFSNNEVGNAPRIMHDFAEENNKLVVKMVALNGQLLDVVEIKMLANLPNLDGGRAMLLGLLRAPLANFVKLLAEPEAQFLRLLAAKQDQK